MLRLPEGDHWLRIASFDPGTETLGSTIIEVDLRDLAARIVDARTFAAKLPLRYWPSYGYVEDYHGARQARLMAHYDAIITHFQQWQPHSVACESPFMGIRAQAFEALVECVNTIRWAAMTYDASMAFEMITPPQAKASVNAAFRGSTKEDVQRGLLERMAQSGGQLSYHGPIAFDQLDDHTTDAMAVGVCHYDRWLASLTT